MNRATQRWILPCLVTFALVLVIAGCGGKEEEAVVAAEVPAAEAEAPAEETASAEEQSTTDDLVIAPVDVEKTLAESDKAVQGKDWTTATDNLLKIQLSGSLKSDAESWQYNRRMTTLQDQLSQAAENGDPKAKAAIELLRKSRRVR